MCKVETNIKILLVDDDPLVRKAFIRGLHENNFDLTTAENSHEALIFLKEEGYAVIIEDFLMPGQDGCDLLDQVQQQWPEIKRILFTASSENHRVKACLENRTAEDIIQKPWDHAHVLRVLENCTQR